LEEFGGISFNMKFSYMGFLDDKKTEYGLLTICKGKPPIFSKICIKNDIIEETTIESEKLSPEQTEYYENLVMEKSNIKVEEIDIDTIVLEK
jgi:hypothetical protein